MSFPIKKIGADYVYYTTSFVIHLRKNFATKNSKTGEGGVWGVKDVWTFPEIHPFWCGQASLNLGLLIELVSSGARAFV